MKNLTQYWNSGDVDPGKLISYFPFKRWEVEEDKLIPIKDKKAYSFNIDSEPVDDAVKDELIASKDELIASMKRELEQQWKENIRLESELEEFKKMGK